MSNLFEKNMKNTVYKSGFFRLNKKIITVYF